MRVLAALSLSAATELIPQPDVCKRASNGTAGPTRRILHHLPKPSRHVCARNLQCPQRPASSECSHMLKGKVLTIALARKRVCICSSHVSRSICRLGEMISRRKSCDMVNIINYTLNSSRLGHLAGAEPNLEPGPH